MPGHTPAERQKRNKRRGTNATSKPKGGDKRKVRETGMLRGFRSRK